MLSNLIMPPDVAHEGKVSRKRLSCLQAGEWVESSVPNAVSVGIAPERLVRTTVQVTVRPGETFDSLLRRFKSGVEREGILGDYKRHQTFMSRGEKARAKLKRAERKRRTRMARRAA